MRSFNVLIWLLAGAISAQTTVRLPLEWLEAAVINDSLEHSLTNAGELGAEYVLNSIKPDTAEYILTDRAIVLDTLVFISNDELTNRVQLRHFGPLLGLSNLYEIESAYSAIINSYPYYTSNSTIYLGLTNSGKVGAVLNNQTEFSSTVAGILGLGRADTEKWTVTGEAEIHLENMWSTAGALDVVWRRTEAESQYLSLSIEEPFPFGLPFGGRVAGFQDLRRGLYVKTDLRAQVIVPAGRAVRWDFGIASTTITPTDRGDSLGLNPVRESTLTLRYIFTSLDNRWLPRRGWKLESNLEGGNHQTSLRKPELKTENSVNIYFPFFHPDLTSRIQLLAAGTFIQGRANQAGNKIYFGGSNSLRGYNEDQFSADWVMLLKPELQYRISNAQVFLFSDAAFTGQINEIRLGNGFGFKQVTKNALITIVYGIARGERFKSGKLHIQIVSRL